MQNHIIKHRINPDKVMKELNWCWEHEQSHDDPESNLSAFHVTNNGQKRKTCDVLLQNLNTQTWTIGDQIYKPIAEYEVGSLQLEFSATRLHQDLSSAEEEVKRVLEINKRIAEMSGVIISPNEVITEETMNTLPYTTSFEHPDKYYDEKTKNSAARVKYGVDELGKIDPRLPYRCSTNALQWHVGHKDKDTLFALNACFENQMFELYSSGGFSGLPMGNERAVVRPEVVTQRNNLTPPIDAWRLLGGSEPSEVGDDYLAFQDKTYFDGKGIKGQPYDSHRLTPIKKPSVYTTELRHQKACQTPEEISEAFANTENYIRESLNSDYAKSLDIRSVNEYNKAKSV